MQDAGREAALRADARLNHDRLLEAAAQAFATEGADTSLKAIARAAGVGIGTLYRRFPTRPDLVEAVYRAENAALAARADELVAALPPVEALRAWAGGFVDYMLVKDGMADALPTILSTQEDLRAHSRAALTGAVATILDAGVADGTLRAVSAWDVLMLLGGITLITRNESDRGLATRLVDAALLGLERHEG
ncbi:TetR/AcrR family transcriptional regulator [Microlunatus flavus]|uniref:DNA-binding transcriptional regulator, AcrR family n=1 Tax=Microlunatus flavus TaxID=1036181 RepID=A0A1H8ZPE8_9ACTN|nr:TetR/AcrR family transcriptional regulator [Microlunatus flavus]SEP66224.1 DNA-binding transcriptional regulator, AcrR family [Microlunatus flavus]